MMVLMDGNQIMRKLIVLCLLAAIGAVAAITRADAEDRAEYCRNHPTNRDCRDVPTMIPSQPQVARPAPAPDRRQWHDGHQWNDQPNVGVYFNFGAGDRLPPQPRYGNDYGYGSNYYPGQCRDVAFMLRDQGFENVRPLRCSGLRLIFSAWRDGESVTLYVSRDGRIRRVIPNY